MIFSYLISDVKRSAHREQNSDNDDDQIGNTQESIMNINDMRLSPCSGVSRVKNCRVDLFVQ